jgi:hypothetical protein
MDNAPNDKNAIHKINKNKTICLKNNKLGYEILLFFLNFLEYCQFLGILREAL